MFNFRCVTTCCLISLLAFTPGDVPAGLRIDGERIFEAISPLLENSGEPHAANAVATQYPDAVLAKDDERQQALLSALSSLTRHITRDSSLTAGRIAEHKAIIDANKDIFGASRAIIAASFQLVEKYDSEIGPLWTSDSPIENLNRADVNDGDIHWAVYTVMQNIIDKTCGQCSLKTLRQRRPRWGGHVILRLKAFCYDTVGLMMVSAQKWLYLKMSMRDTA
jgi:hypothetical protein